MAGEGPLTGSDGEPDDVLDGECSPDQPVGHLQERLGHPEDRLCLVHEEEQQQEPQIICSLGLFAPKAGS